MKSRVAFISVSLLLTACSQQPPAITVQPPTQAVQAASDVGRFQLVQAEYEFVNIRGEGSWTKALFKLDTVTGEMFVCNSVQAVFDGTPQQRTTCIPFEDMHELVHLKPKPKAAE